MAREDHGYVGNLALRTEHRPGPLAEIYDSITNQKDRDRADRNKESDLFLGVWNVELGFVKHGVSRTERIPARALAINCTRNLE